MLIEREIEEKIEKYLDFKEIIALIGPRQAGKTTVITKILDKITKKKINKISFENVLTLNKFEEEIDNFIETEVKGYDILFIDEVQYSKDSGQKLKYIYDTQNIKIILTGSSATELSIQSIKYLVGRIFVFEMQTLTFKEFLKYKNEKLFEILKKGNLGKTTKKEMKLYFKEYLIFGGYPKVVITDDKQAKIEILKNIYNTYLLKEIKEILEFKENYKYESLIKVLALQIGNVINYDDLSKKTEFKYRELKEALNILEKTYICSRVQTFSNNKQVEIVKSPKIYFYDFGLRNISAQSDFVIENSPILSFIYENFVFRQFIDNEFKPKYWRTKSKAEVDFILEKGINIIPIEIKTGINSNNVEKGFRSFIEKYSPKTGYFISEDNLDSRNISNCEIKFIDFYDFVFELEKYQTKY
ncbi:MAG: ATP-binding protein [Nanoarchaeota archaeon]